MTGNRRKMLDIQILPIGSSKAHWFSLHVLFSPKRHTEVIHTNSISSLEFFFLLAFVDVQFIETPLSNFHHDPSRSQFWKKCGHRYETTDDIGMWVLLHNMSVISLDCALEQSSGWDTDGIHALYKRWSAQKGLYILSKSVTFRFTLFYSRR